MTALKKFRNNEGWSQIQVAKMIDMTREYYNALENGRKNPGNKTKEKLCILFKTDHKTLFGY